jgi:hypothetical protein
MTGAHRNGPVLRLLELIGAFQEADSQFIVSSRMHATVLIAFMIGNSHHYLHFLFAIFKMY